MVQQVSRNVRALQKADRFEWTDLIGQGAFGPIFYIIASNVAALALQKYYKGDDDALFPWDDYKPDGHLEPRHPNWIKDNEEIDK